LNEKLPFQTLSAYFRERYGGRVHKIAIDGGFTCPNRDGTKGTGGCAFCDSGGSRAPYCRPGMSIPDQVRAGIERFSRRFKADRFIAYFQSFSGTYAPPGVLRERYEAALCDPRIIGLSVATRSDCLSPEALDVVASYVGRLDEVRLEFGLQTSNVDVLEQMGCGHTAVDFTHAVVAAHGRGVKVCAHVIFGLPGDTVGNVLACADLVGALRVEGVKIHNLYLTPDSRLGRLYQQQPFEMMTREAYLDAVCQFLARISRETIVERVTGDAPPGRLLAPSWTIDKSRQWDIVAEEIRRRGLTQGGLLGARLLQAQQ